MTSANDGPASGLEMMAITIARDLQDGEWVEVGANLPVPRAGAMLAHLMHGPNLRLMIAMTKAYLRNEAVLEDFEFITDPRAARWAEAYYPHDRLLSDMKFRGRGVFYCGGVQIDRHGNANLIGIGADPTRLDFRGPGAIGTCNATVHNGRWHLVTTSHSARVLVERCDYISALGYGDGSPGLREKLGLPYGGPASIITPLCVFDFDPETNGARVRSIHPRVDVSEVIAKTGFALDVPADIAVTSDASVEELWLLRNRIDGHGVLR